MFLILSVLIFVAVSYFPVFYLANKLETGRTDPKSIFITVIASNIISSIIVQFLPGSENDFLSSLYTVLISIPLYIYFLATDLKKASLIAIIPTAIWHIIGLLF